MPWWRVLAVRLCMPAFSLFSWTFVWFTALRRISSDSICTRQSQVKGHSPIIISILCSSCILGLFGFRRRGTGSRQFTFRTRLCISSRMLLICLRSYCILIIKKLGQGVPLFRIEQIIRVIEIEVQSRIFGNILIKFLLTITVLTLTLVCDNSVVQELLAGEFTLQIHCVVKGGTVECVQFLSFVYLDEILAQVFPVWLCARDHWHVWFCWLSIDFGPFLHVYVEISPLIVIILVPVRNSHCKHKFVRVYF